MEWKETLKYLRSEIWQGLTLPERINVLQNIENVEAMNAGRAPCSVVAASLPVNNNGAVLGNFDRDHTIRLNSFFVMDDVPDKSLETVLHEGRHATQQANGEDWKGYIKYTEDPEGYYEQDVEVDARNYSAERALDIRCERTMEEYREKEEAKAMLETQDHTLPQQNMLEQICKNQQNRGNRNGHGR